MNQKVNNQKAKRILALAGAYICASDIAGIAFFYTLFPPNYIHGNKPIFERIFTIASTSILIGLFATIFAFIPSFLVIIIAELKGWHRLTTHVIFGSLIGFMSLGFTIWPNLAKGTDHLFTAALCGGLGGIIYWFLIGRKPSPYEKPGYK